MLRAASSNPVAVGTTGTATVIAQSGAAVAVPADVTEDTVAAITVPANAMGANGLLRVTTRWSFTNNANSKTIRHRFSGGAGTVYGTGVFTTQLYVEIESWIQNANATNSQVGNSRQFYSAGAFGGTQVTSAVDTTAATTLVITGQKAVNTDTMTLLGYTVELVKG